MSDSLKYLQEKYGLDYSQPSPIQIPNVGRLDLIRWIRELGFTTGVEVGVDHAEFSKLICNSNPQLKLYGVDPYLKYDDYHEYDSQEQMDIIFAEAQTRMRNEVTDGHYEFIRRKSMDAVKDFADGSLDFVYIDANHEANFPYEDIVEWARKVRPGGIVAGHDYTRIKALDFTIKDALEKYTTENNIHPWFVLGRYQVKPKEIRDHTRSWMFLKS